MRCVITGAAGFIGSTLAERLVADGHDVLGIDCFDDYYNVAWKRANLADVSAAPSFRLVEVDLNDPRVDLGPLLEGTDWIFHQAARAGVRRSWDQFDVYVRANVLATQRLVAAAARVAGLRAFVYASSSSVYGNALALPTPETAVPAPVSPYGVTKLAGERLTMAYASEAGLPAVALRYFTVYGPRQRPDMAFHRWLKAGLTGTPLPLFGDGEQTRDFTFVDDIVEANVRAAHAPRPGAVYNVGGGARISINEVLDRIGGLVGGLTFDRRPRAAGDARHTSADTGRAREELGYQPSVGLDEGLRRELDWIRAVRASHAESDS